MTSAAVAVVAFVAIAVLASAVFVQDPYNSGGPQNFAGTNEIFIHVVNSTSGRAIAGEAVLAGPVSSPADLVSTIDGVSTASECIHGVPNGSVVVNPANGVVVSNSSTTTYGPCPIKEYHTDSAGWVTVPNQGAAYFLVEPGNLLGGYNAQVITVRGSQTYVTAPFPQGNFTVSSTWGSS